MVKSGDLASDEKVQRFQAEAQAAANFDHPNIVSVYEVGTHDGHQFLAMSFVEGQSLADALRDGPLQHQTAVEICQKTANAISHAHERGIVHRDLKPGNILLDESGEPRVTDFGLARRVENDSDLTVTGQILGTPSFMSPEQANGEKNISIAADIFALGAVLYNTLTGRPPFQAATVLDILVQVREQDPISPRLLDSTIDRDLETICLKCLEKNPERRYESAQSFSDDLGRWMNREPISARRATFVERIMKWVRRRPAAAAAIATSLIAVFCLGIALTTMAYNNTLHTALGETKSARATAEQSLADLSVAKSETDKALKVAKEANQRAREADYYRRMALASAEWEEGNTREVRNLLGDCPDEYRGWEWQYMVNQCNQQLTQTRLNVDKAATFGIELSSNGEAIFLADSSGVISQCDSSSLKSQSQWQTREMGGLHFSMSHDDHFLATLDAWPKNQLQIWNTKTRQLHRTLVSETAEGKRRYFHQIVFQPGSHNLLARSGRQVFRFSADTGEVIRLIELQDTIHFMAMRPHEQQLALSAKNGEILLTVDLKTGEIIERILATDFTHVPVAIRYLQYSPSGDRLFLASTGSSNSSWILNLDDQKAILELPHDHGVRSAKFSSDGKLLITGSADRMIRVWNSSTGSLLKIIRGHNAPVKDFALSHSNDILFALDEHSFVKSWDLKREYGGFKEFYVPIFFHGIDWIDASRIVAGGVPYPDKTAPIALVNPTADLAIQFVEADNNNIFDVDVSSSGEFFATACWFGEIEVRDASMGSIMHA